MADIEKSHHSQDLARARTKSFKTLLDDVRHIIEKGLQEAYQGIDMVMVIPIGKLADVLLRRSNTEKNVLNMKRRARNYRLSAT